MIVLRIDIWNEFKAGIPVNKLAEELEEEYTFSQIVRELQQMKKEGIVELYDSEGRFNMFIEKMIEPKDVEEQEEEFKVNRTKQIVANMNMAVEQSR